MPNINNESLSLLNQPTNAHSLSFFQNLKNNPLQAIKITGKLAAGALSGYLYWPSSFQAAAFGGTALQYTAALSGSLTNAIFNIESFLSFATLPAFKKIPFKYITALFFSTCCIAPNFFMNIVDEEGHYIDSKDMALQGFTAFLNIWVNVVGTLALIDNITSLTHSKAEQKKEELMKKLDQAMVAFSRLNQEVQTENNFLRLLKNNEITTYKQKIVRYSLNVGIGILSTPQFIAYTLISYFGMKNLAEKEWSANPIESIILGLAAAIGNAIPSAGFSIKGIRSTCEKIISLEKPSLLALLFILPAAFSGFTTHKAMADSLKQLNYAGKIAEFLNWLANLGAALIYNLPQMLALASRFEKNTDSLPNTIKLLPNQLENKLSTMDANELDRLKSNFRNYIRHTFFQMDSGTPTSPSREVAPYADNLSFQQA